jgi:DNA-binding transcriptional LysR family regulator
LSILECVDVAERGLSDKAEIAGRIRITASATFARAYLTKVVSSYLTLYPNVSVDLDLTDRMVDLVAEGVDLAIRYGALKDSTLVAQKIAPCRRLICAAPSYWRDHGMPKKPADLAGYSGLIMSANSRWTVARNGTEETIKMGVRFTASMGEVVRQMALDGHGVALLADWHVADDLKSGALVEALPDWSVEPPIGIYAVYPSRANVSPAVRSFISHLKVCVGDDPLTNGG